MAMGKLELEETWRRVSPPFWLSEKKRVFFFPLSVRELSARVSEKEKEKRKRRKGLFIKALCSDKEGL